jgi:hypothetical protein
MNAPRSGCPINLTLEALFTRFPDGSRARKNFEDDS